MDIFTDVDLKLFSNDSLVNGTLKDFVYTVKSFSLKYQVTVNYTASKDFEASCFDWDIYQHYDYTDRNLLRKSIKLEQHNCDSFDAFGSKPMFAANIIFVLILATISLILTFKYFIDIAKMYNGIR